MKWLFIYLIALILIVAASNTIKDYNKEKTNQLSIQLKIEQEKNKNSSVNH